MTARILRFDADRRQRRIVQRAQEAMAERIAATARGLLTSELLVRAHQALADVAADGLPRQSMGEPGGSGGHGDPTLGAVMSNAAMVDMARELHAELERAESAMVHAYRIAGNMAGQTIAPPPADAPGSGDCQRCKRWVSGAASDRIRSGYCATCYQAWRRAGHPDRVEFNHVAEDGEPSA